MDITIKPVEQIKGEMKIPGDKSISHRALLLCALSEGTMEIEGFLDVDDTRATLDSLKQLGVQFRANGKSLQVEGRGLRGFEEPENVLNVRGSGTAARLLIGLLAGQPFHSTVTGDDSLRSRPMKSVTEPLKQMGASINGRHNSEHLPLSIRGYDLNPIEHALPVPSDQVKAALLIAALFSRGVTDIKDPYHTRDHTERALRHLGAEVTRAGTSHVLIKGPARLEGERFRIPGDLSSAAPLIVAATLAPKGELVLEGVGVNPTRTGILEVLEQMGAEIVRHNERNYALEPVADLLVRGGRQLNGVIVEEKMLSSMRDELAVLALAALFARGDTLIKGTSGLPQKDSDRLKALVLELQKMGASFSELPDGLVIRGGAKLAGAHCDSRGDDRIATALAAAALLAGGETVIGGAEAVAASFPGFFEALNGVAS